VVFLKMEKMALVKAEKSVILIKMARMTVEKRKICDISNNDTNGVRKAE
jgi:hypothetical protein